MEENKLVLTLLRIDDMHVHYEGKNILRIQEGYYLVTGKDLEELHEFGVNIRQIVKGLHDCAQKIPRRIEVTYEH